MTDYDEVPTAVRSMKSGAEDYFNKRTLEEGLLPRLLSLWKQQAQSASRKERIYERESEAFRKIQHRIKLVSLTDISVLILGENGTGKDHIARKIHEHSDRRDKPFVAVDCSVLTPSLAASILFGHEKGAFTGATECREDILPLAEFFLHEMNTVLKKSVTGFDTEAARRLLCHRWTGNVRELRQTIQSAVLLTGEGIITSITMLHIAIKIRNYTEHKLLKYTNQILNSFRIYSLHLH